jgi:hypothetical protein
VGIYERVTREPILLIVEQRLLIVEVQVTADNRSVVAKAARMCGKYFPDEIGLPTGAGGDRTRNDRSRSQTAAPSDRERKTHKRRAACAA